MTTADSQVQADDLDTRLFEGVLEITINRQQRSNCLTPAVISAMLGLLEAADHDGEVRVIVITGAGTKAFCAGFDIGLINSPGSDAQGSERDAVDGLAQAVRAASTPVIAAVNGAAVGGGCDLAVACDIRIGTPRSRFGMPPARLGILYGRGGMERVLHTVGLAAAKELFLTGELIDASRSYDLGLLGRIVPEGDLLTEARSVAQTIASNAPLSVAAAKRSLDLLAVGHGVDEAFAEELDRIQERVWSSQDAIEGARAFREGRPPRFVGR